MSLKSEAFWNQVLPSSLISSMPFPTLLEFLALFLTRILKAMAFSPSPLSHGCWNFQLACPTDSSSDSNKTVSCFYWRIPFYELNVSTNNFIHVYNTFYLVTFSSSFSPLTNSHPIHFLTTYYSHIFLGCLVGWLAAFFVCLFLLSLVKAIGGAH